MSTPKFILAAYLKRERRILLRAIQNAYADIRLWQQQVAEYDAAIDAALDDGVDLITENRT